VLRMSSGGALFSYRGRGGFGNGSWFGDVAFRLDFKFGELRVLCFHAMLKYLCRLVRSFVVTLGANFGVLLHLAIVFL
jgi:hypothetical protein